MKNKGITSFLLSSEVSAFAHLSIIYDWFYSIGDMDLFRWNILGIPEPERIRTLLGILQVFEYPNFEEPLRMNSFMRTHQA